MLPAETRARRRFQAHARLEHPLQAALERVPVGLAVGLAQQPEQLGRGKRHFRAQRCVDAEVLDRQPHVEIALVQPFAGEQHPVAVLGGDFGVVQPAPAAPPDHAEQRRAQADVGGGPAVRRLDRQLQDLGRGRGAGIGRGGSVGFVRAPF